MDREELLQRIDASWQDLQDALHGIPPERASEPGVAGEWSVKDLLGHITFWERGCAADVQRLGPEEAVEGFDVDKLNAQEQECIKNRSLDELQSEFTESHVALMQVLRTAEDLNPDDVKGDTWEHYAEHTADIRDWRTRVGV